MSRAVLEFANVQLLELRYLDEVSIVRWSALPAVSRRTGGSRHPPLLGVASGLHAAGGERGYWSG
jgi:hypothetical protein